MKELSYTPKDRFLQPLPTLCFGMEQRELIFDIRHKVCGDGVTHDYIVHVMYYIPIK